MPRGKLEMKLIENPKKRRATYKNRRDGLIQKASQLTTLCGVEALLVCYDPTTNPAAGHQEVTTWPAEREDVARLIGRYRETPADKLRHSLTAATYYQEELAKQQRKLLKVEQCGPDALSLQDCRLADLSAADLGALLAALDDTLRRARRRIAALGVRVADDEDNNNNGGHAQQAAANAIVAAGPPMPLPLAAEYGGSSSSFDHLALFGAGMMPDAGGAAMVTHQYYHYPPHHHDMLPLPLPPPCFGYHQMPLPSSYTFQMPPLPTLIAPPDLGSMTGNNGTVDLPPFATNFVANNVAGLYDDFMIPGYDATGGGGVYVDDYLADGQGFAAGHAGARYQQEHRMSDGAWWSTASSRLNNDPGTMDASAFQQRNDLAAGLPAASSSASSGTSFQGGFQKK